MSTTKEMVEEQLELLVHSCPHDILVNARKLNANYLHSSDPIVNGLLGLDRAIIVPNNTPVTLKFSALVFEFVQWLLCLIEDKNFNFTFDIIPAGSYPSNVKIGDIDEFDFLLKWKMTRNSTAESAYNSYVKERFYNVNAEHPAQKLGFYDLITDIIVDLEKAAGCKISGPTISGPAVNVAINWKCQSGHHHTVAIDLTIAFESPTDLETFLYNKSFALEDSPFKDPILDGKQHLLIIHDGNINYLAATNAFDVQMFSICDKLSKNIRVSYRLLKFIRDSLFPYFFRQKIMRRDNELHAKFEQSISSHVLKQVIFNEVEKFPNGHSWEERNLLERLESMLSFLTQPVLDPNDSYGEHRLYVIDFLAVITFSIPEEAYWFMKRAVDKFVSVLKKARSDEHTISESQTFLHSQPEQLKFTSQNRDLRSFSMLYLKLEGNEQYGSAINHEPKDKERQVYSSDSKPKDKERLHSGIYPKLDAMSDEYTNLETWTSQNNQPEQFKFTLQNQDLKSSSSLYPKLSDNEQQGSVNNNEPLDKERRLYGIGSKHKDKERLKSGIYPNLEDVKANIQAESHRSEVSSCYQKEFLKPEHRPQNQQARIFIPGQQEQSQCQAKSYLHIQQHLNRTLIPIGNILFNVVIENAEFLLQFFGPCKLAYIRPVLPREDLSNFHFVECIYDCLDEILGEMHIVDLVNESDEHIKAVLTLFKLDILSEDDLKTTKYKGKLQAFSQLVEDSGLTSDEILGQYAVDKHAKERYIYQPNWGEKLSSDLERVLQSSQEDIGTLLRFSIKRIGIDSFQDIKTETMQLIYEVYSSLVQKLNTDVSIKDKATDVEEFIRWYCLRNIIEHIKCMSEIS